MARNHGGGAQSPASTAGSSTSGTSDTSGPSNSSAPAQTNDAARRSKNYKSEPLNLHRGTQGQSDVADLARARMRRGEFESALDAFDEAVAASPDPTLRRDRGTCHDKLNQPYPAIEDYRAYLTAQPDAPDADSVNARLEALERELRESAGVDAGADSGVEYHSSFRAMGGGPSKSAWLTVDEEDDTADAGTAPDVPQGPLRRGSGFSLGPILSLHKWQTSGLSFDDAQTWAESVGLVFRYSFGERTALLVEAGYEHFNTTASGPAEGFTTQVALEFRFPLDPGYGDQLTLAPGLGFEHIELQSDVASVSTTSAGAIVPRVRFGWRHMLGPSVAFDVALDLGYTRFSSYDSFPFDTNAPDTVFLGLDVAAHWGL